MAQKKQPTKKTPAKKRASTKRKTTPRAKKRTKGGLTEFQKRFCLEYLYAPSGAVAARRAGSTASRARQESYELLKEPDIQAYIAELKAAYMAKAGLEIESVFRYLNNVINFDIRDLHHEDGRLKMPHELDPDVAGALQGLKVTHRHEGHGDDKIELEDLEYRVPSRNEAADKALKALGAYKEVLELRADKSLRGILNDIAGQTVGPPGLRTGPQGTVGGSGGNRGRGGA